MLALVLLCVQWAQAAPLPPAHPAPSAPSAPSALPASSDPPAGRQLYPAPAALHSLQQLLELQRFQYNPFSMFNQPQPLVILFANGDLKAKRLDSNDVKTKSDFGKVDENLNSIVIDAPSQEMPASSVVLLPNGRFSIGDFISSIPWLPFEVNVPDTISWAYNGIANGISGIISIIGQRYPFQRPQGSQQPSAAGLKAIVDSLRLRNSVAAPIMVVAYDPQPLHLPIQV